MRGSRRAPNIFKYARNFFKVSDVARELATEFSMTFSFLVLITVVGHLVKTPPSPNGKCLGTPPALSS